MSKKNIVLKTKKRDESPKSRRPALTIPMAAREILGDILENIDITGTARKIKKEGTKIYSDIVKERPTVVGRLLQENPFEKAALAELYAKKDLEKIITDLCKKEITPREPKAGYSPTTIFVESGSTVLYVCQQMRSILRALNDQLPKDLSIRTNNHLMAWLFLRDDKKQNDKDKANHPRSRHRVTTPFLFSGYLEEKYHGIFPFYPTEEAPENEDDAILRKRKKDEERRGYAQCRLDLARCGFLMLAASRLSLSFGPMVGSRENAIFKNACYNACVPPVDVNAERTLHLFISVQKLVVHHPTNLALLAKAPEITEMPWGGFHSIDEELDKIDKGRCYSVFDIPVQSNGNKPTKRFSSPFSSQLCPRHEEQPLVDGTVAVSIGHGMFRICSTWEELFFKANIELAVYVSYQKNQNEKIPCSVNGEECSLPNDNECTMDTEGKCCECWIRREVQWSNEHCNKQMISTFEPLDQIHESEDGNRYAVGVICIKRAEKSEEES